ncbi:multiple inositol polyphosphate phosphatase 1-like [Wyeomyia smithii]|uniref:multiple inositol polyphosphate phosphatase 1-like n=1 Tax=Wyeomyia smithii TaxID=174621 RepID=UPI002467C64E|nr:multiple inositol polyphosphate phosphatase 1-like [Wyeomyia smithii]
MEFQLVVLIGCLLCVVNSLNNSDGNETSCQSSRISHRSHYASKTAYEVVRDQNENRESNAEGCVPLKFWLLSQHGTRLPGKKDIRALSSELNNLRKSILKNSKSEKIFTICPADLERLRAWRWNNSITVDRASYLTEQGWNDLKSLAERMKQRFPGIFSEEYSKSKYLFRYTDTQRTEESYKAFAEGLFGKGAHNFIEAETETDRDTLLRPYEACSAYGKNKKRIKKRDSELNKFLESDLYLETVSDISDQLGFRTSLSSDQVEAMWDACRYEQAWYLERPSPWCGVFNKNQVEVLEYKEDLKYYYQNSYGYEKSADLACFTVVDMIRNFEYSNDPRVVAYFTHETQIQIFLTALGVFRDKKRLKAKNWDKMRMRLFKSSQLTPFAANVIAVAYNCSQGADPVRVGFFLNEKELRLDWCRGQLCSLSELEQRYRRYIDGKCSKLYCK